MKKERVWPSILSIGLAAGLVGPVAATTMVRAGLEDLTDSSDTIVVGEIVGSNSFWNGDRTFILTEVRVLVDDSLKGSQFLGSEFKVTVYGGRVGPAAAQVVAGPRLATGAKYVLFLNEVTLPGGVKALIPRGLSQGVFDVVDAGIGGIRALSQASREHLFPDGSGHLEVPGGDAGMPLSDLLLAVRQRLLGKPGAQ